VLNERICLVTGAAQGIGRAIAVEMARQGAAAVAIVDRDGERAEQSAALARDVGAEAIAIPCDLRDSAQITAAVRNVIDRFGGLDVLVNNAGVIESMLTEHCAFDELSEETWDLVHDVNLKAVWLMSKAAAPYLRRSPRTPAVLNAASTAALVGYAHPAYCASKGGVLQLTRAMAIDLAPAVRCSCYCPGTTDTQIFRHTIEGSHDPGVVGAMTATNLIPRPGRPEEVAKLVCFMASEDASFITGAAYTIDGGSLAWRGHR
jgi:NAD(P)-dependent dehydrogenase (short-subunit alcohol dehydrogenase family)